MEAQEFDTALTDLETRVDRLRALYENWFRGYEKTEPTVARKEAERRVYALRKELPRNTALRFRYHQLYQRYTTLATYWQRTARQIEEGTHRLQLQRIKRKRPGRGDPRSLVPGQSEPPPREDKLYSLNPDETLDVNQLLDELDMDQVARAIDGPSDWPKVPATPAPVAAAPTAPPATSPRATTRFARPSLADDAPTGTRALPPLTGRPPAPVVRTGSPSSVAPPPPAPGTGTRPGLRPPARPSLPDGDLIPPLAPHIPISGAIKVPLTPPAVAVLSGGTKPPVAPPAIGAAPKPPLAAPPPVPTGRPGAVPPPPPRTTASMATPSAVRPPPPPMARPSAATPSGTGFSDQQMRRVYDEYAAARRRNNEGEVRFETLQNSIQKMLPDLTKKHQGKQIDFEVVVKDGRVGLKPKAT